MFRFTISTLLLLCSIVLIPTQAFSRQTLNHHLHPAALQRAVKGSLADDLQLNMGIGLSMENPTAVKAFIRDVYDPASPNYRKFLSPEQFTQRFSPHLVISRRSELDTGQFQSAVCTPIWVSRGS